MSVSLDYGDNENSVDGYKAKSQTLIASGDYDAYYIFGDANMMINGSKGGNDIIYGKSSINSEQMDVSNFLYGDGKSMSGSKGGNDQIFGGNNIKLNFIVGDAEAMHESLGGNDQLTGGLNVVSSFLFGDAEAMYGSLGGNDQLKGGSHVVSSLMFGDASRNFDITDALGQVISGRGGNDVLIAGDDNYQNRLFGDFGVMFGGIGGNDLLIGSDSGYASYLVGDAAGAYGNVTGGNDRLISGASSELMWGDFWDIAPFVTVVYGHDTFAFKANNGDDTIFDFRHGDDKIELCGIAGIDDFSDLQVSSIDGNSIITYGTDDSITVNGIFTLQATDFIFS
jgi:hypothetical protein